MIDKAKDYAKGTLAAGITSGATSCTLTTGHAARMYDAPFAAFDATIWNADDYTDPADAVHAGAGAKVRVTAIAGEVLTITAPGVALNSAGKAYKIVAGLFAKAINTDLATYLSMSPIAYAHGTIANGGTATLVTTHSLQTVTFAGATGTIGAAGVYPGPVTVIATSTNVATNAITVPLTINTSIDNDTATSTVNIVGAAAGAVMFLTFIPVAGVLTYRHTSGDVVAAATLAQGGTGGTTAPTAWVGLNVTTNAITTTAIDWALSPSHSDTLSANITYTFSNALDGQAINVAITNTASNYTVTWPTVRWAGGTPPVQTVGAKTDVYTFWKVGANIYGTVSANHS